MRRNYIVLLGALAALTTTAAVAWACTPQAYINLSPTSARSGDTVTVTGSGLPDPANGGLPVEIRMIRGNDNTGPLLATPNGPTFTVNVTVPNAAPGDYTVQAVGRVREQSGKVQVLGSGQGVLQLDAAAAPTPATSGSVPASGNAVGAPVARSPKRTVARSPKRTAKPPSRTQARGRVSPVRQAQPAATERAAATRQAGGSGSGQRAVTGSGARAPVPVPERPAVAKGKSGQAVFADSLPSAPRDLSAAIQRAAGFDAGHSFSAWRIPSLVGGPAAVRPATANVGSAFGQRTPASRASVGEPGPQLTIGAAVLGLGLVLLFGGFAVAEVRRRRVPAGLESATKREGGVR